MPTEDQILKSLNLGSSKAALEGEPNSPLAQLLALQAQDIIDDLRKNLVKYDANASNNLAQDIKPTKVDVTGDEVSISIEAPFYWKFVNYGVNGSLVNRGAPSWGKQPTSGLSMSQAMNNWSRDRGITTVNGKSSWTSKSHVQGMSMQQRGQIARPFYSDVVNQALITELEEPITELMKRAITIRIVEPWQ